MGFELERRGLLLVVSAPSGGGKSEVLKRLLNGDRAIEYSISYTSRTPRSDEIEARHFHFVSREKFEGLIAEGFFYEHAEVHGNLYGTPADPLEATLAQGRDIAMDLDVQGGLEVKRRRPDSVLVFLMPPSMEVLERRLRARASDEEEQVRLRMENARGEIDHWQQYDYVVMNQELDRAVGEVRKIVEAERAKACRIELRGSK